MPARQQQVQMHVPQVLGLVLLHPSLSGVIGPAFSRILARSKLGRSILRPLLRTEIGDVANRRAWHNADKLTAEVGGWLAGWAPGVGVALAGSRDQGNTGRCGRGTGGRIAA